MADTLFMNSKGLRFFTSIILIFVSLTTQANTLQSCGLYQSYGIILKNKKDLGYQFYIFKDSQSEIILNLNEKLEFKFAPYINKPIILKYEINKDPTLYFGKIESILTIQFSNLTLPKQNHHHQLIQSKVCQK